MADLKERRRRWRGPALGGHLQRGARFCFAAPDGEASTARLTEWCRPELVGDRLVTGDDGSLDYPLTRARVPPRIYFGVTTCHQPLGRIDTTRSAALLRL